MGRSPACRARGAATGAVALPTMAGRTNGGAFGSAVCSTWATVKPAARMESSVGRLQSQHTTSRFSQLSRSCRRLVPGSSDRTCSMNSRRPADAVLETAGNHVEHIYAKIDAPSRAAAAMFAMLHGCSRRRSWPRPRGRKPGEDEAIASCPPGQPGGYRRVSRSQEEARYPSSARTAHRTSRTLARPSTGAATWDDTTVSFVTIRQSHSLAPLLRGLPGDSCQCPHWGYLLAGKITVSYADREETYQAGDAFYMTPGHVPAAEAGTEFIQFSPREQLAETLAAMRANAQRVGASPQ